MTFVLSCVRRGLVVRGLLALFDCSWAVWRGFESEDSEISHSELGGPRPAASREGAWFSVAAVVTLQHSELVVLDRNLRFLCALRVLGENRESGLKPVFSVCFLCFRRKSSIRVEIRVFYAFSVF